MKVSKVIKILEFDAGNDRRGWSFALDANSYVALPTTQHIHFASIRPLAVRGNHYHAVRNEIIVVFPGAPWELYWDTGASTAVNKRIFEGSKGVAVIVPLGWSHAIRNPGEVDICIASISDRLYTAEDPDTFRRSVAEGQPASPN